MSFAIVGVDPSSKRTAVCRDGRIESIHSHSLKDSLLAIRKEARVRGDGLLVLWDSPLSFSRARGYSNRSIDQCTSGMARAHPQIEKNAVNTLHFTGVTHWALTLDVLGLWIDGERQGPDWSDEKLQLVDRPEILSPTVINVVEVHPAVALCAWWLEKSEEPFKRYKGLLSKPRLERCRSIWNVVGSGERLSFKIPGIRPDDVLDAWAAWKLGCDWLQGKAEVVGSAHSGGFLLPKGRFVNALKKKMDETNDGSGRDPR